MYIPIVGYDTIVDTEWKHFLSLFKAGCGYTNTYQVLAHLSKKYFNNYNDPYKKEELNSYWDDTFEELGYENDVAVCLPFKHKEQQARQFYINCLQKLNS